MGEAYTDQQTTRSTARGWKGGEGISQGQELALPSGNVALVRRIKPEAFLDAGFIPDPLTSMVMKAVNDKKGLPPAELNKIANDRSKLGAAMQMMDRVLSYCVVDPPVEMPPKCVKDIDGEECSRYFNDKSGVHTNPENKQYHRYSEGHRDPDILYTDVVTFEDKSFIFNWAAGGTSNLEQFRREQEESVESLSDQQNARRPAKRASGHKR